MPASVPEVRIVRDRARFAPPPAGKSARMLRAAAVPMFT
jgi:hypothetical protein